MRPTAMLSEGGGAIAVMIEPHQPLLLRLAIRFTENRTEAEDLLQGFLLKLLLQHDRIAAIRDVRPWLVRALYHHFIDERRSSARYREVMVEGLNVEQLEAADASDGYARLTGPEDRAYRFQLRDLIVAALEALPGVQRLVLTQHDIDGNSLPEISRRQNISINTLKSALQRGRSRLRDELAELRPMSGTLCVRRRAGMRVAAAPVPQQRVRRRHHPDGVLPRCA